LDAITNARVLTPGGVLTGAAVVVEEGRISGVFHHYGGRAGRSTVDAGGRYVLPGLVDLHSDAIEAQFAPRPGVHFPPELVFLEMDRYFAASGVATGFHAIALVEGAGRTVSRAREHYAIVARYRHGGLVRHEVHLRCELAQEHALKTVEDLLGEGFAKVVSLMDHTPGQGAMKSLAWYEANLGDERDASGAAQIAILQEAKASGDAWALGRVRRLVRDANNHGAVLASHDDDSPERVELLAREGVSVSEFPVNLEAARRANEVGLSVCMGAPNVVRGRSSGGNLSATEAVKLGLVDALVSDYHPPSLLQAAFKLAREGVLPLHRAVGLVSSGPARAVGLGDRGEIREGALADLVVVGERLGLPVVTHTIVGGELVLTTLGSRQAI
jgi:alpha-D-ribose 1-methylphosphonate 5-triphosphate diphosphatase